MLLDAEALTQSTSSCSPIAQMLFFANACCTPLVVRYFIASCTIFNLHSTITLSVGLHCDRITLSLATRTAALNRTDGRVLTGPDSAATSSTCYNFHLHDTLPRTTTMVTQAYFKT
jgi:hypothetical protein